MYSIPPISSLSLMHGARAIALPLAIATLVASCGEGQKQAGPPPPAVTVAEPIKRTVFDYDEYVGRFTAINSVEVRARVSGYLDELPVLEMQLVKITRYTSAHLHRIDRVILT